MTIFDHDSLLDPTVQLRAELTATRQELERLRSVSQAQLQIAKRVHESLLPKPIRHPRIDVESRYVPLEAVGGDYCQVRMVGESDCYITLCDVTGHGVGAALMATRVSSEVRRLIFLERYRPMEIVQGLNAFVFQEFGDTDLQLSFFSAKLDLHRSTITYSGAGHPGPLLVRRGSGTIETLHSQNLLIGVAEHCLSENPEATAPLHPGDRLIFFTDGMTETIGASGRQLGEEGLGEIGAIVCSGDVSEMADCILERVAAFRAGPVLDDMTLIIAELK